MLRLKNILLFAIFAFILFALYSCGEDLPPDDGTPEPPTLNGTFVCGDSKLIFNGDGRSVTTEISADFSERSGLPSGISKGTYVFLFHNGEWRYDKAESFRITAGGDSVTFPNALEITCENTVAFRLPDGDTAKFEKSSD